MDANGMFSLLAVCSMGGNSSDLMYFAKTEILCCQGPMQSLGFLFRYRMEDGGYSRT
jgi:hypothetical protein